ncbi:MAG: lipopolysaccharide heptosyltransferase II [Candidatus Omnitrophica bacterium]|nr:lipopolysaccharide heptosyltransferase II [Candidatus Omnitrophota bacterium]
MNKIKKTRKKILIFSVNWLGDVIFTSPFIRAVREAFPDSYIACAVPQRCKEILESNTRINELIPFDEKGPERSLRGKLRFTLKLRKDKFDTVFLLHRSMTRALIARTAGIKTRIGYDTKKRGFLLTEKLKMPPRQVHRVQHFLELARAAGLDASKNDYEFFITELDRKKALRILDSEGVSGLDDFVAINPGGNWAPKRWPAASFAELADKLIEKYGVKILITGAEKDKTLTEAIMKDMKNKPTSVCGKTGLRELASIFERARLVVSGDSGPMHIAVSTGVNVVALFGPTSPDITGPYGKGNYEVLKKDIGCEVPCYDPSCGDNRCMKAITVDDVLEVIEKKGYLG